MPERALTAHLLQRIEQDAQRVAQASQAIALRDAKIDKLSSELAQLRRIRFGVKSEQLDTQQHPLFEEAVQANIAALQKELTELKARQRPPSHCIRGSSQMLNEPRDFKAAL